MGYGYDKYRYHKPSNASPAQIRMFLAVALGALGLAAWSSYAKAAEKIPEGDK